MLATAITPIGGGLHDEKGSSVDRPKDNYQPH